MNLVAVYNLPMEREALGAPLAEALGVTLYEANARLRAPGPGPLVVAVLNDSKKAKVLKDKLQASGLPSVMVADEEVKPISSRLLASDLSFDEKVLRCGTKLSGAVEAPYSEVKLLLHAMSSTRTMTTETIKETKIDIGKAVMTGGLSFRKTTESTLEHFEEKREPFVLMLTPGKPVLEFKESGLTYEFLGAKRQLSRAVNFNLMVSMLKEHCLNAVYDNRLLQKPEQTKILGPMLNPEAYLDAALTVLAKVLWVSNAKTKQ